LLSNWNKNRERIYQSELSSYLDFCFAQSNEKRNFKNKFDENTRDFLIKNAIFADIYKCQANFTLLQANKIWNIVLTSYGNDGDRNDNTKTVH